MFIMIDYYDLPFLEFVRGSKNGRVYYGKWYDLNSCIPIICETSKNFYITMLGLHDLDTCFWIFQILGLFNKLRFGE